MSLETASPTPASSNFVTARYEVATHLERRAGELLREMPKASAGRPAKNRSHDVTDSPASLSDLGISKMQSSRWQSIAALPEAEFEA